MKNISLYDEIFDEVTGEVKRLKKNENDKILNSLTLKYETDIPNLERMCYIMETTLLNRKRPDGKMYVGFQKLSRAEEIWDRFLDIAENVDKIYVFGENDRALTPHKNIKFIHLPKNHKLIREWFLVINSSLYKSMMVAYDLDGFGVKPVEKDRNFKGAKTTKPDLVNKSTELLEALV
ncbi:DICT sensory domain-containing protein [Dethiothermospora halolimnae]|uniref:DICT sensory domain-containing protein n=1 Tax=Dethiothermospora halolimnae TaxID=3114390 RepID=UPI003CCC1994